MRNLILYAAFLSAVAGYHSGPGYRGTNSPASLPSSPSSLASASALSTAPQAQSPSSLSSATEKFDIITTTPQNVPSIGSSGSSSSSSSDSSSSNGNSISSSSNNKNGETTTVNSLLAEIMSELPNSSMPDDSKRRYITYDQRQEGQYNIRADLENFMIVLIPPTPADGLNLLDLLTKATYRRNNQAINKGKKREKHYMSSTAIQPESIKFHQALKSSGIHHINFLTPIDGDHSTTSNFNTNSNLNSAAAAAAAAAEYIEGRTPYQVDISSTANDDTVTSHGRMQGDRQVDVLPPPYPLAYQQLIKPYHLEAESTLIQALPPTELTQTKKQSAGNYLEAYNQIVPPKTTIGPNDNNNNKNFLIPPADTNNNLNNAGNYFRLARAIRGDNQFFDTNRVASLNNLLPSTPSTLPSIYNDRFLMNRRTHTLPIYRADLSLGAAQLYPPLDIPHYSSYVTLNARNREEFKHSNDDNSDDSNDSNSNQSLNGNLNARDTLISPSNIEDDLELDLHGGIDDAGIAFVDPEAKTLLSDGIERCAPGKRRDSYGVCRQIGDGY